MVSFIPESGFFSTVVFDSYGREIIFATPSGHGESLSYAASFHESEDAF